MHTGDNLGFDRRDACCHSLDAYEFMFPKVGGVESAGCGGSGVAMDGSAYAHFDFGVVGYFGEIGSGEECNVLAG